jgi:hypothetical protein
MPAPRMSATMTLKFSACCWVAAVPGASAGPVSNFKQTNVLKLDTASACDGIWMTLFVPWHFSPAPAGLFYARPSQGLFRAGT